MKRYLMAGLVLAVLTTVVVGTSLLGAEGAPGVLLGAALGGALGLVPDGSVAARAVGFLAGAVLAWVGYVLRAAALPDSAAGRAVAALAADADVMTLSGQTVFVADLARRYGFTDEDGSQPARFRPT